MQQLPQAGQEEAMPVQLVTRLRFARSEFLRCLEGVAADEAVHRFEPMNCISWMVGHLAHQEDLYWRVWGQGLPLLSDLAELVGWGRPASTPPLEEMWAAWRTVTTEADQYLDTLTSEHLPVNIKLEGKPLRESVGTLLLRNTYHYWYHTGEAHAVRQMLGHTDLPQFVGNMAAAFYSPEH
jgi:uncharacterized damage-inducible protein DinB